MSRTAPPDPARTRVLAERWSSWVLPHWLERQADPANPAFEPAPPTGGVTNLTVLDRALVGVLDGAATTSVDPRGLVTPGTAEWSLDWWVGADDRWHLPAREAAVRQSLVGDAPVVETAMRVPTGDVVHTVWAFRDSAAGDVLAVEIENRSKLPVAMALSVRPYGPDGAGRVGQIEVTDTAVTIDHRLAVWLPKPPALTAVSSLATGDVAASVLAGDTTTGGESSIDCRAGFATAAIVFPLAHTASLRLLIPLGPDAERPPEVVPPADAVARGWASHLTGRARIELPDPELSAAFAGASARLVLDAAGRDLTGEEATTDTAAVVGALDRLGIHDQTRAIVATLPLGQGTGGRLGGDDDSADATGAALSTAGRHWRVGRDDGLIAELAGPLAAGGHHHTRGRGLARRNRQATASFQELGWRLRGILDVETAVLASQPEASAELGELAASVRRELDARVAASPKVDARLVDVLALVAPLGVLDPSHELVTATLDWVRANAVHEGGVAQLVGATGLSPRLTSLVGRTEARRGERSALDRLDWFVRAGGPTRSWADLVHPRLATGCGGDGSSAPAAAAFVDLVLDLLVHESPDECGLVLCPVWPEAWLGAAVEAHGLRTTFGAVSFAIRWHGERPALLWEIDPHPGVESLSIAIPGLDPSWSSTDLRGDALLAAPTHLVESSSTAASEPGPEEGASFG